LVAPVCVLTCTSVREDVSRLRLRIKQTKEVLATLLIEPFVTEHDLVATGCRLEFTEGNPFPILRL